MILRKKLVLLITLTACIGAMAQQKVALKGSVLDGEMNNEPLPFATIFIKGTAVGATTDFDGNYSLLAEKGAHTLVFSFIGYESIELQNIILDVETVNVKDVILNASEGLSLDEIVIQASVKKESESALLVMQQKAIVIQESIGSERLTKLGITNAAVATSKISGVTKNEASGDIYIRGLGDRYLSTTMNGLPIPSDDVEKKNIDLNLFSANIIENVGITKTYSTESYADQASGTININSKKYNKKLFSIGAQMGSNSNVIKSAVWSSFKTSPNMSNTTLGFHTQELALIDAITLQPWNTDTGSTPIDFKFNLVGGTKFKVFGKKLSMFTTVSHSSNHDYQQGIFKQYRSNVLDESFTDAKYFRTNINTTGLIDLKYQLNSDHKISYNTLFVNKTSDQVYEAGRNEKGYVFDQDPSEYGAFVRDQNLKQTRMSVNQLIGKHNLSNNNTLEWATGYNYVWAGEPNRIRNEVNILDENTVQFAHVGDFQQRKSNQKIVDTEYNGFVKDQFVFKPESNQPIKLNVGFNFRQKERDFSSLSIGVRAKGVQTPSINDVSAAFTQGNFDNGTLTLRERTPDLYLANLDAYAGYANVDFGFSKLTGNFGVRYETDKINVLWNVANYVGRNGSLTNNYTNILPSLNLKYSLGDKTAIRFAASKTLTLPEFKELAPFEYVSPTGRVTAGNPELKESTNYNLDVKWELFPSAKELISFSGFYKAILDPINLTQARGSSGNFTYDNTGKQAAVIGLEFETRWNILKEEYNTLNFNFNATKMWFNQDLYNEFQYNGVSESKLQGASDLILNAALNYSNNKVNEFGASLSGNYSSDKIFALGAPEDFSSSDILYNDEIIEKGFFTLDIVLRKKINENFSMNLKGLNLINPAIKQTQNVKDIPTQVETTETVSSYKKGIDFNLGLMYAF